MLCLAALSNDPLGDLNPAATYSVNLDGTLHWRGRPRQAGVERFLFASSCSLYGAAGSDAVAEDADLFPVTPYGETKVEAERASVAARRRQLQPDLPAQRHRVRRLAAAPPGHRGEQPHRRRDDDRAGPPGKRRTPWRPLVHIEDISRAFLAMLEAPRELVHDEAFNVGRAQDNVQVRDIAEMVRDAVPGSTVSLADGAGPDLRNYRVDFSKLNETFPDLKLRWSVREGIDELAAPTPSTA